MKTNLFTLIGLLVIQYGIAQQVQSLDSVTIESTRIDLPLAQPLI